MNILLYLLDCVHVLIPVGLEVTGVSVNFNNLQLMGSTERALDVLYLELMFII